MLKFHLFFRFGYQYFAISISKSFRAIFRVAERNLGSEICRDGFLYPFFREGLKNCSDANVLFRGLTLISFYIQFIFFVKRKVSSTIEQPKSYDHEKVIDFYFRIWSFIIEFPSEIKVLPLIQFS